MGKWIKFEEKKPNEPRRIVLLKHEYKGVGFEAHTDAHGCLILTYLDPMLHEGFTHWQYGPKGPKKNK